MIITKIHITKWQNIKLYVKQYEEHYIKTAKEIQLKFYKGLLILVFLFVV